MGCAPTWIGEIVLQRIPHALVLLFSLFVAPACGRAAVDSASSPPSTSETPAREPAALPAQPQIPFEDAGACPFEGCIYREWTALRPISVRRERDDASPIAFELRNGDRVTAVTGIVITTLPGLIEFAVPTDVETSEGPLHMAPGETLYVLTPLGEGHVKAWARGRLYADVDASALTARRPVTMVWWVMIRNAAGQTGWTRQTEDFDGKDSLA